MTRNDAGRDSLPTSRRPVTTAIPTATKPKGSRTSDDSAAGDKTAARAALADAVRLLATHGQDAGVLHLLADLAAGLRPHVDAGALDRVSVVACLTAAAATAGVGQQAAERAVVAALDRGAA